MSHIRKAAAIVIAVFIMIACIMPVLAQAEDSENVALVRQAFEMIAGGNSDVLGRIVDSVENMANQADQMTLFVEIPVSSLTLDEPVPGFVQYSCTLPSAAAVTLSASGFSFGVSSGTIDEASSFNGVEVTGYIPVMEFNSQICIDISYGDSPISLFLNLCFYNGDLSFLSSDGRYSSSDVIPAVEGLGKVVAEAYGQMLGVSDYASDEAVKKEISTVATLAKAMFDAKFTSTPNVPASNQANRPVDWSDWGSLTPEQKNKVLLWTGIFLGALLLVIAVIASASIMKRENRMRRKVNKRDSAFRTAIETKKLPKELNKDFRIYERYDYKSKKLIVDTVKTLEMLSVVTGMSIEHRLFIADQVDSMFSKSIETSDEKYHAAVALMAFANSETDGLSAEMAFTYITNATAPDVNNSTFWKEQVKKSDTVFGYLYHLATHDCKPEFAWLLVGLGAFFKKHESNARLSSYALDFFTQCIYFNKNNQGIYTGGSGSGGVHRRSEATLERFAKAPDVKEKLRNCGISTDFEYQKAHSHKEKVIYEPSNDELKEIIAIYFDPRQEKIGELTEKAAQKLAYGSDDVNSQETTLTGWTIAALCRCAVIGMDGSSFQALSGAHEEVIDAYNRDVEELQNTQKKLDAENGKEGGDRNVELVNLYNEQLGKIRSELRLGILHRYAAKNYNPIHELARMASDSQHRHGRYAVQSAIIGLLPFLMQHKDSAHISDAFAKILSLRAELISEDKDYSFFEVRVPDGCDEALYAKILKEVLYGANPSLDYDDTVEIMRLMSSEIPDVMKLLSDYPLRLIDPANKPTQGFYKFKPYEHQMWVNYTPPEKIGQVHRRYHEIVDLTVPNSVGLQVMLFTDKYRVIPTIFHENLHYLGDRNEASVWLQTHLYSKKLYGRFSVDTTADFVFQHLNMLLGDPPAIDSVEALNKLILQCYGEPISEEEAKKRANETIEGINNFVVRLNVQETWSPEVRMPMLAESPRVTTAQLQVLQSGANPMNMLGLSQENRILISYGCDESNYKLLKDIIVRAATAPRSITKPEFNAILRSM